MKKLITLAVTVIMLAVMLAVTVSAAQTNMEVTVPKFRTQPVFDGKITEAEWGKKTLRMVTEGAATEDSTTIGYNAKYGLRNTLFYSYYGADIDSLAYDLWIRWDANYLYVAAIVDDPNAFSLPKGGEEIWNGDCIQIRVDEIGPSAIMFASDPEFNYKTDAFNGARYRKPWSNDREVFNGILGLVKGKTPTIWRCGKIYGDGWNLASDGGKVGISLKENSNGTCTITYECAIPWGAVNPTLVPRVGDVYGMGVAVACSDSYEVDGFLQWGHGVMSIDENVQPRGTRGGSQAIVLSADYAVNPNGWVKESGYWVFYSNGVKLKNQWKRDSVGWCYLDGNGRMKTNAWVKDSAGWCYVGSNGYCVTNQWKKDSNGWCYLDANGQMATNKWVKDSVGWCYVGANGYCVTNTWQKDSKGWCYLDANGRMVTNKWVKDSKGWCYVGADGYAVTNCWKRDSVGWCYLDKNGSMLKYTWFTENGKTYFIDKNGYMVTGTVEISGKKYTFDSSGALVG